MSGQGTLSPSDYAKSTGLEAILNKAVNDCYLTQSPCPAATMVQLLRATYTLDTFSDISLAEVCDGDGNGYSVEVSISLTSGQKVTTVASHSNNTVPFHPTTGTTGRKISLIPKEVLNATGPMSLQNILAPPALPPPVVKKGEGGGGGGGGGGKGQAAPPTAGLGDVDPQSLATSAALARATRFRLTSSVRYFNQCIRPNLLPLRAVAQRSIDNALLMGDPVGPFENLLGQVAASISLCCAKAAALSLNKPLALYIHSLYQGICGREGGGYAVGAANGGMSPRRGVTSGDASLATAPPSLSSTVALRDGGLADVVSGGMADNAFAIPNLVVTVFSTDPRGMGKVRVREVCLVVNVQQPRTNSPSPLNALTIETVSTLQRIIEVATAKAAAIAANQCGATVAEVEASMMPIMPDGSVRYPFFESLQQMVDVMEQSIREVTAAESGVGVGRIGGDALNAFSSLSFPSPLLANPSAGTTPNATPPTTSSKGPLREFSVGLVIDGSLCHRPQLGKYAWINNEPEITGPALAEQLTALVGSVGAASSTATSNAKEGSGGKSEAKESNGLSSQLNALPPTAQVTPSGVLTYLEDTHAAVDIASMQRLMYRVGYTRASSGGGDVIIAGNHLYGSDATALSQGASLLLSNNAVLRMSDVGRLSTILEHARLFRNSLAGSSIGVIGDAVEGDGVALAHLALGLKARTIRIGGLQRKEHTAIVNELLSMSDYLSRRGMLSRHVVSYNEGKRMPMPPAPVEITADAPTAPVKKGKR